MEGGIMADLRASGLGGVPKGETADRPSSPSVGDVFYNGTLGCLEIYTAQGWVANSAPPGIPTIGTATYSATNNAYNNASASVAFTPGEGGGLPNLYRATSTPGGYSGTATSSPITVSGLQSTVSYTFSVTGTNNFGTSAGSTNSNSITANTIPQAPTIGTATLASATSASLTFTANATGGASVTNYKYSTDGITYTALSPAQTTSPLTITVSAGQTYSFYIKAVNINGDSVASSASNSVYIGYPTVTGGALTSDSTYYYRTFIATSSLGVADTSLTADILTIAGGAGGGGQRGGGGGAGGVVYSSSVNLTPGSKTVTVGGGGAAGAVGANRGGNGVNSQFASLTEAVGGGGGGGDNNSLSSGANGGSGGGACNYDGAVPGSATAGQGNNGGTRSGSAPNYGAGGGGGAGAVGGSGNSNEPGVGGSGTNSYSTMLSAISSAMTGVAGWSTATSSGYIAGGGAGGYYSSTSGTRFSGGAGGGGRSGASTGVPGENAVANTGSGAGGGWNGGNDVAGGSGGSGIVIVRYTKSQVGG
jgi:hypothetical protein